MDVQTSPAALPELHACLGAFHVRFRRPEGWEALERYTTGLLTELPHKHGDPMAQAVPGTSAQRWQECLTNMPWDEEDLNRQRVTKMIAEATTGDGVLVVEARQERYVVAGRTDVQVSMGSAASTPVWRADEWLYSVPRWQWRPIRWRRGTTGWLRQKCVAVWCWRVTSDGPRHRGWLVGERATRGQPEERTYGGSNLPAETTLAEVAGYAHRRHAIEPCHEEAKGELGWDQDQGRLWPGFHRHAVTVMLAYSVLVWLELRQRRRHQREGRRRDLFVPPAEPQAQDIPSRAS